LQKESEELRTTLLANEEQLKTMRLALDSARDRRGEISATAAGWQSDMQHMAESCLNELNLSIAALQADETVLRVAGETLATEEAMYREMRARLEAMGPGQHDGARGVQRDGRTPWFPRDAAQGPARSIENTQATIKEIDLISKEKFQEAFRPHQREFPAQLPQLFGGGQAFMRLTDIENSAESGIDVVASPPGKEAAERPAALWRREGPYRASRSSSASSSTSRARSASSTKSRPARRDQRGASTNSSAR